MSNARGLATTATLLAFLAMIWKELPTMRRYVKMTRM